MMLSATLDSKRRRAPAPRAQSDPTMTTPPTAVLQRSLEVPVVVDFHASWCGPCQQLGPALERLADQAAGGFVLARVDVDKSPELASAFRVQSIPMVVVVQGGRMVDGFQGALPEAELKQFVQRHVPDLEGAPALEEARALREAGDVDGALVSVERRLAERSDDLEAHALRGELLIDAGRSDDAVALLEALDDAAREDERIKAVLARVALAEGAGDLAALEAAAQAAPEDVEARTAYGKALLAGGRSEEGLEELLDAVRLDPDDKASPARKAMREAFDALGLEDPVANRFRYELSLVLFA